MDTNQLQSQLPVIRDLRRGFKSDDNNEESLNGLFAASALGLAGAIVVGGIFMISTLVSPKALSALEVESKVPAAWLEIANSTVGAHKEELCVGRIGATGKAYLDCSPNYHKGRKAGGKLIADRLEGLTRAQEVFQYNVRAAAAEITPVAHNIPLIVDLNNAKGWGQPGAQDANMNAASNRLSINMAPLPSRAPANLRLIRAEQGGAINTQMNSEPTPAPAPVEVETKRKRVVASSKRCKARSYWSVKHNECRRKRGR